LAMRQKSLATLSCGSGSEIIQSRTNCKFPTPKILSSRFSPIQMRYPR
jgi:hypothetical protein